LTDSNPAKRDPRYFTTEKTKMPNYNPAAAGPPYAIYPGDTGFAFNNENPSAPQASQQFALGAVYDNMPASVSLELSFPGGAPTACQYDLQEATTDADANYVTVPGASLTFASLNASGVGRIDSVNLKGRFVRVRKVSQTGGGACTAIFLR
jgi:hypothetical protein